MNSVLPKISISGLQGKFKYVCSRHLACTRLHVLVIHCISNHDSMNITG